MVKARKNPKEPVPEKTFAFEKANYLIMIAGFGLIILGFILMSGGGTDDPAVFSDKIFSPRRITVAPILILLGFIVEIYAILKIPKESESDSNNE